MISQFDLVISTFKRPDFVKSLIGEIKNCHPSPSKIIVVEGDLNTSHLGIPQNVDILYSKFSNQPYQRQIGFLHSESPIVIFFDDDLIDLNRGLFSELLAPFEKSEVVGSTIEIDYQNPISESFSGSPHDKKSFLHRVFWRLAGIPSIFENGQLGALGIPGKWEGFEGEVNFFYGPVMAYRREVLGALNYPFLWRIYNKRLGKGEDKVLSLLVSKNGVLWKSKKILVKHPPRVSHYSSSVYAFYKRSTYSRLLLSLNFSIVNGSSKFLELLRYLNFVSFFLFKQFFTFLFSFRKKEFEKLAGIFSGSVHAIGSTLIPFKNRNIFFHERPE